MGMEKGAMEGRGRERRGGAEREVPPIGYKAGQ